jgi:uncharacterized membrane protein
MTYLSQLIGPNRKSPWSATRRAKPYDISAGTIREARLFGLGFVFVWFRIGGIATSRRRARKFASCRLISPGHASRCSSVVVPNFWVALGLLRQLTRHAAGVGLFLLTIAVTPAHIYMLQRPDLFSVPYWMLVLRLPLQAALLVLIAWSTAPSGARTTTV